MDVDHLQRADEVTLDLAAALAEVVDRGVSDFHLKAGNRPLIRIEGELGPLSINHAPLAPWQTEQVLHDLLPDSMIKEFEYRNEIDFAYSVPGLARFRVNAYKQRGSVSLVLRVVARAIRSIADLGLPAIVRELAERPRGVVLVTGSTGSGKSTTLAAIVQHINLTMCKHIVTIEDPIEYLYKDARASIDQREVGSDTESFGTALRQVMRQDPDVIFIGEMRDEETVRTALSAAETGHLVLSSLHTLDAPESINRILDFFPNDEHQQVRAMLASTLQGVISQRLVPGADGVRRVAIAEIMTMTGRVHDMIIDAAQTARLNDVISEGEYYGMQTFDQALYNAVKSGAVTMERALQFATHPHDFKLLVAAEGRVRTSMADLDVHGQVRQEIAI